MSGRNYWFAFGVGVLAGATVALLYAPQTGARTRRQLRKGVGNAGDYLEEAGDYLREQAERLTEEAQKVAKRAVARWNRRSIKPVTSSLMPLNRPKPSSDISV